MVGNLGKSSMHMYTGVCILERAALTVSFQFPRQLQSEPCAQAPAGEAPTLPPSPVQMGRSSPSLPPSAE